MPRKIKDWKYKDTGSLAQYKQGEYVGAIPHELLYQLLLLRRRIGKDAFLVKVELIKKEYDIVDIGKEVIDALD